MQISEDFTGTELFILWLNDLFEGGENHQVEVWKQRERLNLNVRNAWGLCHRGLSHNLHLQAASWTEFEMVNPVSVRVLLVIHLTVKGKSTVCLHTEYVLD